MASSGRSSISGKQPAGGAHRESALKLLGMHRGVQLRQPLTSRGQLPVPNAHSPARSLHSSGGVTTCLCRHERGQPLTTCECS